MTAEVKVPVLPESVADATLVKWYKQAGATVTMGESLVDLETDKVMLEVPAPVSGTLVSVLEKEGSTVVTDQLLAVIEAGAADAPQANGQVTAAPAGEVAAPAAARSAAEPALSPAVRRALAEQAVDVAQVVPTGRGGRIVKADVARAAVAQSQASAAPAVTTVTEEKRVPMTRLRQRIAERLVQAQQTAAMLTTFNEVDMQPIMDLRRRYQDEFVATHDVRLGIMSFFVKAAVTALQRFPEVNASIDGTDMVYHGFFDVGIAVSSPRGLVVPIIRQADQLSLAEIELKIREFAEKAKEGRLTLEEMTGGTFTLTNGGVFGSMLSTPILNPPQSAILGMHNIVKRPVVVDNEIVIRPMMYLALSYDHRIIDGAQSVRFLVTIKSMLEDPARLLLDI